MSSNDVVVARQVESDMEVERGIFKIGSRYHVRTPTYQYTGRLVAVTGTVFMFEDTATVYETGPYPEFYAGRPRDSQPHEGAGEMIVDRAGTVLHLLKH